MADYTSQFTGEEIDARLAKVPQLESGLAQKQDTLQSGVNIKTVNSQSILGSGNLTIGGSNIDTVTVSVDNTSGNPSGSGSVSGSTLSLSFTGLVGATGATGAAGPQGSQGPQGPQGNPGSSQDYPFSLANNFDGGTDVALTAEMGKVLQTNKVNKSGVNLFLQSASTSGKYINSNGAVANGGANVTDFFPVTVGDSYVLSTDDGENVSQWNFYAYFYDASKTPIADSGFGLNFKEKTFVVPTGAAWFRFTFSTSAVANRRIQLEKSAQQSLYRPFNEIEGAVEDYSEKFEDTINGKCLKDFSVPARKGGCFTRPKNLIDENNLTNGLLNNTFDGGINSNTTYAAAFRVSQFIPVEEGETYNGWRITGGVVEVKIQNVTFFNSVQRPLETPAGYNVRTEPFTIPAGVSFVRVCFEHSDDTDKYMFVKGSTRVSYDDYNVPKLDPKYIDLSAVVSEALDSPKFSPVVSMLGKNGVRAAAASLAASTKLSLDTFPQHSIKNVSFAFACELENLTGNTITLYYGDSTSYEGIWFIISPTTVEYRSYVDGLVDTWTHGATIGTFLRVMIDYRDDGKIFLVLNSISGAVTHEFDNARLLGGGESYVLSSQALTNVKLSASCKDFQKPLWMFGDSYFTYIEIRSIYYQGHWGKFNVACFAHSGASASYMYNDLVLALNFGCPKYLIWALGMNNSADAISKYQDIISICEERGIELIMVTVPTTPTRDNEALYTYIKNSGFRYIDAYAAVGSNASGQWYSGYMVDNVHPNAKGAQAIATQYLVDCPELMQY